MTTLRRTASLLPLLLIPALEMGLTLGLLGLWRYATARRTTDPALEKIMLILLVLPLLLHWMHGWGKEASRRSTWTFAVMSLALLALGIVLQNL
ncbi:hypothetical protein [Flavobacterium sp.]|uniref:hypothetical protein n=1 Tax=Flavobacterium sp. TaxID=239 RepID=UPI0022C8C1A3|nr:hypothetical protein [Flavobacterium sp.]MCZ8145848.1 hypothetical protein [Flavobacterium sp.]MCZ8366434.1 hypothetical protein [Flavobacterium sp.]